MTPEQEQHMAAVARRIASAIILGGIAIGLSIGSVAYLVLLDREEILTNRVQIQEMRAAIEQIDNGSPPTQWQSKVQQQLEELREVQATPTMTPGPLWPGEVPMDR